MSEKTTQTVTLYALLSLLNPLELIKSRYQTMVEMIEKGTLDHQYKGIKDCARSIISEEGIRALWKGNLISLTRFLPSEAISYQAKNWIYACFPDGSFFHIVAGIGGGLTSTIVLYPT